MWTVLVREHTHGDERIVVEAGNPNTVCVMYNATDPPSAATLGRRTKTLRDALRWYSTISELRIIRRGETRKWDELPKRKGMFNYVD